MSILDPKAWAAALAAQGAPIAEDVVEKAMNSLGAQEIQAENWIEAVIEKLAAKYKVTLTIEEKGTN